MNKPPTEKKVDLEKALAQMLTSHTTFMNETKATMQNQSTQLNNHAAQLRNLEVKMGQMANLLTKRQQGSLPSNSEINLRGERKEYCKEITLRSGREVTASGPPPMIVKETRQSNQLEIEVDTEQRKRDQPQLRNSNRKHPKVVEGDKPMARDPPPLIPYPQRLKKDKIEKQFANFLDIFKKLHINIPFLDALENMPSYVKLMKKILENKKKLGEYETIALTEECSAILQKKLPPKLKDLGSFTIPFSIGNSVARKAVCNLGVSINLMSLSMFKRLKLGEAKPTIISSQLAYRSYQHPQGVIENVLMKVDKFIFPVDFIILYMEEDDKNLIILGRPFLATGKAQINVQEGKLKLRVQGDEVTFHVFQATKHPDDEPNDDIQECHPQKIMQSDVVNCKDKLNATQKETKRVKSEENKIFHPP